MVLMTRKNALKNAISAVEKSDFDDNAKQMIIEKLELCISELPFAKWSEAAIFDACDQFIEDNGRPLILNDFTSAQLPSHPTIKNRFGMTLKEFRDLYYPLDNPYSTSKYKYVALPESLKRFHDEFIRCEARTREDYDRLRDKTHPCSATILKIAGTKSWDELLLMTNTVRPAKPARENRMTFSYTHEIDRYNQKEGTQG